MAKKKCWKLLPCAMYDLEKLESWLQDMAAQGWHQRKERMVGKFEAGEPKQVRYRLQPKPKWYDGSCPDSDMVKLFRDMGWDFVTAHGDFYIFRAEEEAAPELNTEPRLMAHGFRAVMWGWGINAVLFALLLVMRSRMELLLEPVRYLVSFGPVAAIGSAVVMVMSIVVSVHRCVRLIGYRRRLMQAQELDHRKPWKQGALGYRIGTVFFWGLWLLVMIQLLWNIFSTAGKKDITEYPGGPPIVTLAELSPEGEYSRIGMGSYNKYMEKTGILAYILDWRELAQVTTPEGQVLDGHLIAEYYDTASPWLAENLARELEREAHRNERYTPVELPELGLDYAAGYYDSSYRVILRQGSTVIDATLDEDLVWLWLELTAEQLK